jgi:hypothetical protein
MFLESGVIGASCEGNVAFLAQLGEEPGARRHSLHS